MLIFSGSDEEALLLLSRLVNAETVPPVLSEADLTLCLNLSQIVDSAGLNPSDSEWTPTWDMTRAQVRAWELRLNRVGTLAVDVDLDGQRLSLSQQAEFIRNRISELKRGILGSHLLVRSEYHEGNSDGDL